MTDTDLIQFTVPQRRCPGHVSELTIRALNTLLANTYRNAYLLDRYTDEVHELEVECDLLDRKLCPRINGFIQVMLHEKRSVAGSAFRANEENLRKIKRSYTDLKYNTDQIIKWKLQNEHAPSITREEIRTILDSFSQYRPGSLDFLGGSNFEFIFENCTMASPNSGLPIKLPSMIVRILPSQSYIRLLPLDEAEAFLGYDDYLVVHPHITSSAGTPCWGDFAGPISQAMHSADLTTLLFILLEFLNTVDPNDSAGRYWPHWIGEEVDDYDDEPEDETAD